MGTSVFAGQDNCYPRAYPPMLERALNELLRPLGIFTEVRNGAHNGDGAEQEAQLACTHAIFNLDQVDYVHQFWDMMPDAPLSSHERATRTWLSHPKHPVFAVNLGKPRVAKPVYQELGYLQGRISDYVSSIGERTGYPDKFPFVRGHNELNPWFGEFSHWGARDDGRCHMETREGFDGVVMQNWHPGPLRNQHYSDMFTFFIAQAALLALDDLERADSVKWKDEWGEKKPVVLPPPTEYADDGSVRAWPPPTCLISHSTQWNAEFDITKRVVQDSDNPFEELKRTNLARNAWVINVVKPSSNTRGARDKDKDSWDKSLCDTHVDIDHGWVSTGDASGNGMSSDWLNLKVPPMSTGPLTVCISGLKGDKAPYQSFGLTENMVQIRIDNKPFKLKKSQHGSILHSENMCIVLEGKVPSEKDFIFSIKAEKGFRFNVIWGW